MGIDIRSATAAQGPEHSGSGGLPMHRAWARMIGSSEHSSDEVATALEDAKAYGDIAGLSIEAKTRLLEHLLRDDVDLDNDVVRDAILAVVRSCASKGEFDAIFGGRVDVILHRVMGGEDKYVNWWNEAVAAVPEPSFVGSAPDAGKYDALIAALVEQYQRLNDPEAPETLKAMIRKALGTQDDIRAAIECLKSHRDMVANAPSSIDSSAEAASMTKLAAEVESALSDLETERQLASPNDLPAGDSAAGASGDKKLSAPEEFLRRLRTGQLTVAEMDEKVMLSINTALQQENQRFQMLQTSLQMNMQTASTISNLSRTLHETAMVFINNLKV